MVVQIVDHALHRSFQCFVVVYPGTIDNVKTELGSVARLTDKQQLAIKLMTFKHARKHFNKEAAKFFKNALRVGGVQLTPLPFQIKVEDTRTSLFDKFIKAV